MNTLAATETNERLAAACQECSAACCRKGKLFLPEREYLAIRRYLAEFSQADIDEFDARCTKQDGFRLYDQQTKCQFLDEMNLCRLHTKGVKPSECFWWPFHVYAAADGELEIRLSTSCCDGFKAVSDPLPFTNQIALQAGEIGFDLLRTFRKFYAGSYGTIPAARLSTS